MTLRPSFMTNRVSISAIALVLLGGCATVHQPSGLLNENAASQDTTWVREELYFGSDIPTGGIVTDSLWEDFVNREIVARFPEGFTTLPAIGRYRYKTGEIKKEPTRIVILYHSPRKHHDETKVSEIIELYKKRFSQESVLRVRSRMDTKF